MSGQSGARTHRSPPLDPATAAPFGVALGHRLRRAREDTARSADQVASDARLLGLGWDRPTVSRIEGGQRQLTAAELLLLPLLYDRALAALLPDEPVALTEGAAVSAAGLRRCLVDSPGRGWALPRLHEAARSGVERMRPAVERVAADYPTVPAGVLAAATRCGWADDTSIKAAKRLGADRRDVAVAAQQTWGRGLAAERDARLGAAGGTTARARQARRGHITRALLAEIRPAVQQLVQDRKESTDG